MERRALTPAVGQSAVAASTPQRPLPGSVSTSSEPYAAMNGRLWLRWPCGPLAAWHGPWHDSDMASQIWGTFSVKDHCQPNAFVREVLLFDRLVLPVPSDAQERSRWSHPNPKDPQESWDPDRLDVLRNILGSQEVLAEPVQERGWLGR